MPPLPTVVWSPDPVLFQAGPLAVRWYGALFALAFLLGFVLVRRMFVREGRPERDLDRLLLYVMVGTVVGARLGEVLFYNPAYYLANPVEIVKVWEGGLASHGGAIGIFAALWLYARRRPDQPYLWVLDRVAVPTALAGAFIRVGNVFNSEILGTPTDLPWGVVFARVDLVPRHPVQLYEAAAYGLVFLVLHAVYRQRGVETPHGLLTGLFLVLVFWARFALEAVKVPQAAFGEALPLSVGQLLSVPAIVVGVGLLAHARRAGGPRVPAARWALALAPLAVLAPLVGCGGDPAPTTPDPSPVAAARPPGPAAFAEVDTLALPAPDFERPALDGDPFRLADHRGEVVLVNFWATWCLPCKVETPDLVALQAELQDEGVRFVGVSLDEGGFDDVRPFADEFGVNYPLVLDDGALLEPYGGLVALPTTLLVDRDGVVRYRLRGLTSGEQLRPLLRSLIAGETPNA